MPATQPVLVRQEATEGHPGLLVAWQETGQPAQDEVVGAIVVVHRLCCCRAAMSNVCLSIAASPGAQQAHRMC